MVLLSVGLKGVSVRKGCFVMCGSPATQDFVSCK